MKVLSFDVGIVNLAYCIIETSDGNNYGNGSNNIKITNWENISMENTKDQCVFHTNLINNLDSRSQLLDKIDIVLIEKQPSFNPKMRIVSGCLQTYFYIRGVIDSEYKVKMIRFISPKLKFNCYTGPEIQVTGKKKYTRTKKMGVEICKFKLKEHSESDDIIKLFESSPKKDDLADSYLQALSYIKNNVNNTLVKKMFNNNTKNITKNTNTNTNNNNNNNNHTVTKIIARNPSEKVIKSGKYTKSNIKYIIQQEFNKFKNNNFKIPGTVLNYTELGSTYESCLENLLKINNNFSTSIIKHTSSSGSAQEIDYSRENMRILINIYNLANYRSPIG